MIKAGIIGGSGYTAGELLRLLIHHPDVEIDFVYSTSKPGQPVTAVHGDLTGDTDLAFSGSINPRVDVLFLCVGHGNSLQFLQEHAIPEKVKIIDLSRDFRLSERKAFEHRRFVYGLPELQAEEIASASNIANPGCFATTIELALLPLAREHLLNKEVHIHGITGSTGAGQTPRNTTHFSWRNDNVSTYKTFTHQHLDEISESLAKLYPAFDAPLNFIPVRGNFTRGIFVTAYTRSGLTIPEARSLYRDFYNYAAFTHISEEPLHLKQVVNTNKCLMHLEKHGDKLLVTCILDNLLKGASGQAVENMNLMFGFNAKAGLQLKSTQF